MNAALRLLLVLFACRVLSVAQTNTYPWPADGNVGIGTTSPWAKLDIAGGDIVLRDIVNQQGYRIKSYGNADSLWLIPTSAGNPRLVLGRTLSWDSQVELEYSPGTVGAGEGLLTIGQRWKFGNSWTHGITRFLTSGVERMRIGPTGNVGIGTINPFAKVAVEQSGGEQVVARYNSGNARAGFYTGGTSGATFVGSNLTYSSGNVFNYDKTGLMWHAGNPAGQAFFGIGVANGTAGNSAATDGNSNMRLVIDGIGNVGIGTTAPSHKFTVSGTIRAKEIIVDTGWADYVFADDYQLSPLHEVEAHIKENRHLPGIPSATEIKERGVALGEMQTMLLAKIEELTLHLIAQEKRYHEQREVQREEIAGLRAEIDRLVRKHEP